uniref:Uncharacterized protein n=1 Tax=Pundamilia nyererei TaxID=303518 RepID=A0A3B4GND3_9CICH
MKSWLTGATKKNFTTKGEALDTSIQNDLLSELKKEAKDILRQNLISRGLQKHMKKLEMIGQNQNSDFQVCDEHFGYRSRLKQMFEDNNKQHKVEAQQVANNIIEECKQYIADKCNKPADFSDGYITELLQNVEKSLNEKSVETRSAFEVDLKVYLCNASLSKGCKSAIQPIKHLLISC